MSAAFTPGPWNPKHHGTIGNGPVEMYWLNERLSVCTENPADLGLIAAAPELYEALGVCVAIAERALKNAMSLNGDSPYDIAMRALAKARGDQ